MECHQIQDRLSEYMDDRLSTEEKTAVEEHLRSCTECAATLGDLNKTVGYVKGLEAVEPPLWLTRKVMAKVRGEVQLKQGLLQKLFYPLHIKLPIEAVATVLVIGLAIYVYRDIAPEMRLAQTPPEESSPQVSPAKPQPSLKYSEDRSEEGFHGKTAPAPSKPAEEPSVSGEMKAKADNLTRSGIKDTEKRERAETPAPPRSFEQAPAVGAVAKDETRQTVGSAAPRAKLSYMEKKKQEPLVLSVFVGDPEPAAKEIEKILKDLEAKAIRIESGEGKKVVSSAIKASRLQEFSKKLKAIGEIRQKDADVKDREGDVTVRIEVERNP